MKIKIGDLTKRQISKICQQTECCTRLSDGYVCPLFNKSDRNYMVAEHLDEDTYNDVEVDIPEDI